MYVSEFRIIKGLADQTRTKQVANSHLSLYNVVHLHIHKYLRHKNGDENTKHLACQQPWMKRRSSTINGSKETKTSEKKPQRQWSAQQWATEIDWEQRTKDYKYDMTTETRTDRPQIDTSRMNNDDHAYVTPAPRAPRSGHRNDRPSERRDFDQDLQHSRDDPAIVMIGRPRDDILAEIRPSHWSAFPETTSTSLNPRARTSLTPRLPRTRTSPNPTSLGTRTRTSPKARTCPNQASPMLTRRSITKTLSRFSNSTKSLYSIATDMTELDTLDRPRLQRHDAGSLVYANTDIPSMAWSAMRTPRSTTATTPWRQIASIR